MRMTVRTENGIGLGGVDFNSALRRLAAFEDTGLEPEQIAMIISIASSTPKQDRYDEKATYTRFDNMGLSVRTVNALLRHGFRSIEQIADYYQQHDGDMSKYSPRKWYNEIKNMGKSSAYEVEEKMRELGLIDHQGKRVANR